MTNKHKPIAEDHSRDDVKQAVDELEQLVISWEKSKGRIMKSYLPTRDLLFLLCTIQTYDGLSGPDTAYYKKICKQTSEAISMLLSQNQ